MRRKYIFGLIGWLVGGAILTYFFLAPTVEKGGKFSSDVHFIGMLCGGLIVVVSTMFAPPGRNKF